jgi:hypothetical protein
MVFIANAQYVESFTTPGKGILTTSTCSGNLGTSCTAQNFGGVNWTIGGLPIPLINTPGIGDNIPNAIGLEGIDADDWFYTIAGDKIEAKDVDGEVYWQSPLLNISAAGTVTFAVDLEWDGFDATPAAFTDACSGGYSLDYIKVQYSIDGGAFVTVPSIAGTASCATVGYLAPEVGPFTSTGTATQTGITGSTLVIRVLISTSVNAELVRIAEVRVPTAGVTLNCTQPVLTTTQKNIVCNGPNSGSIDLTVEHPVHKRLPRRLLVRPSFKMP